jgi:hypothetical protein
MYTAWSTLPRLQVLGARDATCAYDDGATAAVLGRSVSSVGEWSCYSVNVNGSTAIECARLSLHL